MMVRQKNKVWELVLLTIYLAIGGCTTRETVKPPIAIPQPTIDTIPAVIIYHPTTQDTFYLGTKIDTVYHDTTIIKYYPKDSQFILQQNLNILRYINSIEDKISFTSERIDSIQVAIKTIADKKPESYPLISKLGWAFLGFCLIILLIVVLGYMFFRKLPA